MNHEPAPNLTTSARTDVVIAHKLHRDYETRSKLDLDKVGAEIYAADPSTEIICIAYAVDDGQVARWFRGDPVPDVWFEAEANSDWTARAHNDAFESAIERHILHPRHGFPLIPPERHRCTQAAALSLGLPAKLGLLADVLKFKHRKDEAGGRLMRMMSKPRKPREDEDPNGTYWHEDEDQLQRLSDYNVQDVEVEREADARLGELSNAEQRVWTLSNTINIRGFHIDRNFAEAAVKIARAAKPEIDDELAELTNGAVTAIGQIKKMAHWLKENGCETEKLDKKAVAKLLEDDELPPNVARVLELRVNGAQAAVKKLDALMKRAGSDDRIRGAFKYHGAHTGRWAGEGYQPQNLKKPETKDLDAAISAVLTGDYAHLKALYDKPLAIVGDCSRPMIVAAPGNSLISADLSSIESRALAWVAGEEWKLESYCRFDETGDPRLEPYCETACRIFGVPSGTYTKASPERSVGKTGDLSFGYMGGVKAWKKFKPEGDTDLEIERFKAEWRDAHPMTMRFWYAIDRAAIKAVHEPNVAVVCGPVTLKSDGEFLTIELPSGRKLAYPNPRLTVDDRDNAHVVYDDNSKGRFAPCRGGFGAYGGTWTENTVSGISRDVLVEAMFRCEAAGYPIVLHCHDEVVCEVPIGFGSRSKFLKLITQRPAWAPDLPIAAEAWRGPRYGKSGIGLDVTAARRPPAALVASETPIGRPAPSKPPKAPKPVVPNATSSVCAERGPSATRTASGGLDVVSVSFTRFKSVSGDRLSKLYEIDPADSRKILAFGGTDMARGEYETLTFEGTEPPAVLAQIGARIETLGVREAIGLGVVAADQPATGRIITKAADERRRDNPRSMLEGITRTLDNFSWPAVGALGLLLIDGDDRDRLFEILTALCPSFAEIAALVRPSASASVKDPVTGERWKTGEHVFVLIDEPSKANACLWAFIRLSWCIGSGRSKGWLGLAANGRPLVYGPVDVGVASPERLVYEGKISLGNGLEHLPRNATVCGGKHVLCADEIIAFAENHAPAKRFNELVAAEKADPAFLAKQAERKAAYKAAKLAEAVARGVPLEVAEKEFERVKGTESIKLNDRIWRELSPSDVLHFPNGEAFLASEMAADPIKFHGRETADPIEGLNYKSRNPGLILHQGGRVEIISRAHADQFAYFLPLYTMEGLAEALCNLGPPTMSEAAMFLNKDLPPSEEDNEEEDDEDEDEDKEEGEVEDVFVEHEDAYAHGSEPPEADKPSAKGPADPPPEEEPDPEDPDPEAPPPEGDPAAPPPEEDPNPANSPPSGGGNGSGDGGGAGPQPGFFKKAKRVCYHGPLSTMADVAAKVLIDYEVAFYQRGPQLVRPVTVPVQSFHGTMATASQLVGVSLPHLRDKLCQNSSWVKFDGRSKRWKDIHPPVEAAQVLLERYGHWSFRVLSGIISTPTMRADGSILQAAGYDPATQLLLIDPPKMPAIPEHPTKADAEAALAQLKDLIVEFPFVDDEGVSRAVGLSAIISPVFRGAFPVVPVHIIDAPEAGTGKSYLLSTVSWIATGQAMPALGSDKQEELDKRLDAAVLSGQQLICIDNSVNSLGGETLCRLTEQWRPQVRIFGVLKLVYVDARGITFYANGNNVVVRGDFCRRVIRSRLDALMERPNERQFRVPSPMEMVLADRGKYIAACLTICRAYIVAGRPGKLPQLASYGEWSDTVRSALVWLGEADPVKSQDMSHQEDPERAALLTLANEWESLVGAGRVNGKQMRDVVNLCDANKATPEGKEYINKGLREAVLAVMPVQHRLKPDAVELGNWLRGRKERRVGKLRFRNEPATGHKPVIWWVEREK